jgi:Histidine kinase-like ATPase domain
MYSSRTGPPAPPSPTGHPAGTQRAELEPRPASAAAARRMVRAFVATHRLGDDLGDSLCLVASELVTNAVLHARTPLALTLELRPGVARIAVRDQSPATLAVRSYSSEAVTGRGLAVVAALSRTWGMVADGEGKLVWAEFPLDGAGGAEPGTAPRTVDSRQDAGQPAGAAARTVRFPRVPVATYLALQEHNDALYRELELLAIEREDVAGAGRPLRLRTLARELLGPRFRGARDAYRKAVAAAQERGETTVDLQANGSPELVPMVRTYVALLDEADEYCRDGVLLTMPPDRKVTELRHWFAEQFAAQLEDGRRPLLPPG